MTKKILKSILLAVSAVLAASLVIIMGSLYNYFGGVQQTQLKDQLLLAAGAVEQGGQQMLPALQTSRYRLTLVAADGSVLYDSAADAATLENHADRKEIKEALQTGEGESVRYSNTLLQKTVYEAHRLKNGTVLRIAAARSTIWLLILGMLQPILIVLFLALLFSWLLASRLAKKIVRPLNELDLEHPTENDTYEELAPLLSRMNLQQKKIRAQLLQLQQKRDEFAQITGYMNEGLVLLDDKASVVSINPAAARLFNAEGNFSGQSFLTVDRSHELSAAIQKALQQGHSAVELERNGRQYRCDISRIVSQNATLGAVLLLFDVTEQALAERTRREFTANVSHELKTPLQGIIGSAELIENNMVKPEDLPHFAGMLRKEATRLLALIEDIIRLSRLDEGAPMPREQVELNALAESAVAELQGPAQQKQVTVTVQGSPVTVNGVRPLLQEVLHNLCENAVKYNVPGGSVTVTTQSTGQNAVITVADTGIGIAPEHQSRVFERFYRVDKSHSKASGGTGLGLSIVKHAVQYHNGTVTLQSTPGKGTVFTVTLPLKAK